MDLASEKTPGRAEGLDQFLEAETERLRARHRFGLGGREIAAGRSDLVDVLVARACQTAASELAPTLSFEQQRVAVVALGGYGRRELAPCSDVDLLFLHADGGDEDIRAVVEHALAILRNAGLRVGHRFRTVDECVAVAREDLRSRTAVFEARLLTGSATLFGRLVEQMDALVFASPRATETFLASLRFDLAQRYERFGRAVGLDEPHVKEGAGGLRDLHVVLWVGHALFGARGLPALHAQGHIDDRERGTALRAYDHLYRVRNEAHFATGRKTDLLRRELQPALAANLGYHEERGVPGGELFMREYRRQAEALHGFARAFLARHSRAMPRRGRAQPRKNLR
jgi:[protein-PII] uridylyltransferase